MATPEDQLRRLQAAVYEPTELGRRMRAARAYADISQKELAGRLGVSASDVRRWEDADATKARVLPQRRQRFLHDVAEACAVSRNWVTHIAIDLSSRSDRDNLVERLGNLSYEARIATAEISPLPTVEESLNDADEDAAGTEKDDDEPDHTKRQPN